MGDSEADRKINAAFQSKFTGRVYNIWCRLIRVSVDLFAHVCVTTINCLNSKALAFAIQLVVREHCQVG